VDKAVDKCPELSYIIEKKGNMFNRIVLNFYLWVMGWSGSINSWAWRKQAAIVRENNRKEEENYLKELKKKL
tara:strand:+ start:222 stop:437 length:216 start_codon:yes stop_codon:yes gene_type:complete